jgi:hypothetical protein
MIKLEWILVCFISSFLFLTSVHAKNFSINDNNQDIWFPESVLVTGHRNNADIIILEQQLKISIDDFEIAGYYVRKKRNWQLLWTLVPKSEINLPEGYRLTSIQIIGFLANKDGSRTATGDLVTYGFSPPVTKKWSEGKVLDGFYDAFTKKSRFKPSFFQLKITYIDDKNISRDINSNRVDIFELK